MLLPPAAPRALAQVLGAETEVACFDGRPRRSSRASRPRRSSAGVVRASIGLGTTAEDVDLLVDALGELANRGPRATYRYVSGLDEYESPAAGAR
jgi:selenocysteine lyase/cysteine desulfurase